MQECRAGFMGVQPVQLPKALLVKGPRCALGFNALVSDIFKSSFFKQGLAFLFCPGHCKFGNLCC